ncbi:glutathione S-transferase family protein [Pseudoroseomonas globiformis]|uniref:Glutathione S-transferase family protein n=1 Tax=Teichococcus globiformis TaxID=2307229 RepID=A0ABV7G1K9_9PROT
MARELVFYTNPMSRGRIVRWMLEETGEAYRTELLDYGGSMKSPDFLAINPMGKVPTIRHGGTVVTEAAAICAYLADAFPAAKLAPPPESPERGPYYRWLFFGAGVVEPAASNAALGFEVPPDQRALMGYGCLEDVLNTLEQAVSGGGWLAGSNFSAADLYLGAQIGWGMQFGTLPKRPAFERFWERCSTRPAAIRARSLDEALMPAAPGKPSAS